MVADGTIVSVALLLLTAEDGSGNILVKTIRYNAALVSSALVMMQTCIDGRSDGRHMYVKVAGYSGSLNDS